MYASANASFDGLLRARATPQTLTRMIVGSFDTYKPWQSWPQFSDLMPIGGSLLRPASFMLTRGLTQTFDFIHTKGVERHLFTA